MENLKITIPNQAINKSLKAKIDTKTKPLGALGQLEKLATQIGLIQQSLSPELRAPHLFVFAADHGIAKHGVSAYPQEVTYQMVVIFLYEGAAINVFAKQNQITLKVVDAGVNHDFGNMPNLINAKIGNGTKSFLNEPAMTADECVAALKKGGELVDEIKNTGCNVIGFGEMGIGNTSSAALLMHAFTGFPLADCVGFGTGLNPAELENKFRILEAALEKNKVPEEAIEVMRTYGGFEIAMMCGAMLKAASLKMIVLVDGFIATAAYLAAYRFNANIKHYAIFCHESEEKGHKKLLEFLNATPVLKLDMRLGEGTGCALAYPILQSSVNFLNQMASFKSAHVSTH